MVKQSIKNLVNNSAGNFLEEIVAKSVRSVSEKQPTSEFDMELQEFFSEEQNETDMDMNNPEVRKILESFDNEIRHSVYEEVSDVVDMSGVDSYSPYSSIYMDFARSAAGGFANGEGNGTDMNNPAWGFWKSLSLPPEESIVKTPTYFEMVVSHLLSLKRGFNPITQSCSMNERNRPVLEQLLDESPSWMFFKFTTSEGLMNEEFLILDILRKYAPDVMRKRIRSHSLIQSFLKTKNLPESFFDNENFLEKAKNSHHGNFICECCDSKMKQGEEILVLRGTSAGKCGYVETYCSNCAPGIVDKIAERVEKSGLILIDEDALQKENVMEFKGYPSEYTDGNNGNRQNNEMIFGFSDR